MQAAGLGKMEEICAVHKQGDVCPNGIPDRVDNDNMTTIRIQNNR